MVCTKLDTSHVVGLVSRFLSNLSREYWNALKGILGFLRGTSKTCVCFGTNKFELEGSHIQIWVEMFSLENPR